MRMRETAVVQELSMLLRECWAKTLLKPALESTVEELLLVLRQE